MQVQPDDVINVIIKHISSWIVISSYKHVYKNKFCNNYFRPFDVDDNSDSDLWMLTLRSPDLQALLLLRRTHLVKFNGIDPLLRGAKDVQPSEVPDAVVHTDVKTAFIKLMRLKEREHQKQEQIITMNMLEKGKGLRAIMYVYSNFSAIVFLENLFLLFLINNSTRHQNRFASLNRSLISLNI